MTIPPEMEEEARPPKRRRVSSRTLEDQSNRSATQRGRKYLEYEEREYVSPTDEELEEWAERERKRREAWLSGPTEEEKLAWFRRERRRRLAELEYNDTELDWLERDRVMRQTQRNAQLAMEGAMANLWNWPWKLWVDLIRAGRDAEESFDYPVRRRRIPFDDEDY